MRQHVNPLSAVCQTPLDLPRSWVDEAFSDPARPLTIDVGAGLGGWCLDSAAADGDRNFLGLELRPGAAAAAEHHCAAEGLSGKNCKFFKCNANVDLENLLAAVGAHKVPLERVLIQFPDPHFKKKHKKRRVVDANLARVIEAALRDSAFSSGDMAPFVYVVSDVLDAAEHMRDVFREATDLVEHASTRGADDRWLKESPLPHRTEREAAVLASKGDTSTTPGVCFRALFAPRELVLDDESTFNHPPSSKNKLRNDD